MSMSVYIEAFKDNLYLKRNRNTSNAAVQVALSGGAHTYTSITGGRSYSVVSDVDVFVRSSAVSALYGAQMDLNTDGLQTGATDFTALTELQGLLASNTDDAAVEIWFKNDGTTATTNKNRAVGIGKSGGNQLDVIIAPVGGVFEVGMF